MKLRLLHCFFILSQSYKCEVDHQISISEVILNYNENGDIQLGREATYYGLDFIFLLIALWFLKNSIERVLKKLHIKRFM